MQPQSAASSSDVNPQQQQHQQHQQHQRLTVKSPPIPTDMDIDRLTRKYLLGGMSDSITSNTLPTSNTSGRVEDIVLQRSVPLHASAAAGDAGGAVSFISNGLSGLGGERLVPANGAGSSSPRGGGGGHPTSPPLPTDLYMDQLTRKYLGADRGPPAADAREAAAQHPFHTASGGGLNGEAGGGGYPLRPALRLASPRRPVDLGRSAAAPPLLDPAGRLDGSNLAASSVAPVATSGSGMQPDTAAAAAAGGGTQRAAAPPFRLTPKDIPQLVQLTSAASYVPAGHSGGGGDGLSFRDFTSGVWSAPSSAVASARVAAAGEDEYLVIEAPRRGGGSARQRGAVTERGLLVSPPNTSRHSNSELEIQPETFCVSCQSKLLQIEDSPDFGTFHGNVRSAMNLTRHETFQLTCDGRLVEFAELRRPANRGKGFALTPVAWHVTPDDLKLTREVKRPGTMLLHYGTLCKSMPVSARGSLFIKPHVATLFDDKTLTEIFAALRRLADLWQQMPVHPNVMQLFRVYYADVQIPGWPEVCTGLPLFFVGACLTGDLEDEASRCSDADPSRKIFVEALPVMFAQVATALAHLHAHHLVHGDVRCANVFVRDFPGSIVLSNFGFTPNLRCSHKLWSNHVAGKESMAPEVALRASEPTALADTWGLGMLLVECLDVLSARTRNKGSPKKKTPGSGRARSPYQSSSRSIGGDSFFPADMPGDTDGLRVDDDSDDAADGLGLEDMGLVRAASRITTQRRLDAVWRQDELDVFLDGEVVRAAESVGYGLPALLAPDGLLGRLMRQCLRVAPEERLLAVNVVAALRAAEGSGGGSLGTSAVSSAA